MEIFDQEFKDKLSQHETPPSAEAWSQIAMGLQQKSSSRRGMPYWRVAASLLLLLSFVGGGYYLSLRTVLRQVPMLSQQVEDTKVEQKHQLIKPDVSALATNISKAETTTPSRGATEIAAAVPKKAHKRPQHRAPKIAKARPTPVKERAVVKALPVQTLAMAAPEPVKIEMHTEVALEEVEKVIAAPAAASDESLLAMEESLPDQRSGVAVTITYIPSEEKPIDKVKGFLEKKWNQRQDGEQFIAKQFSKLRRR
ncbi:hypothetical protein [Persicobacter psychrovividus]|uniref:Uncharacterized protein n=1 Tax=Persicobacter psychrovividus TaxID=387638 RepID=A0ABM7VH28_9BACT|nr:hypothetical protein PEPS_25570 [Persicobacter psychrovividus]